MIRLREAALLTENLHGITGTGSFEANGGEGIHLSEGLHVDDVDQSEEEDEPVLHTSHIGEQQTLRQHLHH